MNSLHKRGGFAWLLTLLASLWCAAAVAADRLPDFTKLVEQNSPAVVNVSTTQKLKAHAGLPPGVEIPDLPENSPWGDLFRKFFGEDGNGGGEEFDTQSLGSGFIVEHNGYIVTNYHVVKDADSIIVRLSDRRELPAKVVGSDERSDIALLKVDATGLPVVKIGSSAKLKVGEWVLAIGSPFGFDHSVSVGVVSAKGRSLPRETYVPFIQTDVAINPGNSGGPLFNLDGEVVGINSQIYSRTGGFMGVSFAIPVDVAMDVVHQLKTKGKVSRGWLGVLIQDVNRELAESFGMDKPEGAVVLRVLPNSPAAKAGFKVGDVVVRFDDKEIVSSADLPVAVGETPVNSRARVRVMREGKPLMLSVTIGELPAKEKLAMNGPKPPKAAGNRLGITVTDLSDDQRQQLGIDKQQGVLVKEVDKGPAAEAGIRPGDVILMLNSVNVKDAGHFAKLAYGLPKNKAVPVLVQRPSGPLFLALRVTD